MPRQRLAFRAQPAVQSDVQRHRLADGKGTAMKSHHIYAACALMLAFALTAAVAQTQLNSGQVANSLAAVSNTGLSLTGAEMRQAAADNVRNYPGALPPRPLSFPQMAN